MKLNKLVWFHFVALSLLSACNVEHQNQEAKLTKYMLQGKQLYEASCVNCHQKDGAGLKGIYPPLKDIYLSANMRRSTCIIMNGSDSSSKALVRMPAIEKISPLELATLLTYVDNSWGKNVGLVSIDSAKKAIADCR
jgi:mono/diheme cytochrome c family protein